MRCESCQREQEYLYRPLFEDGPKLCQDCWIVHDQEGIPVKAVGGDLIWRPDLPKEPQ